MNKGWWILIMAVAVILGLLLIGRKADNPNLISPNFNYNQIMGEKNVESTPVPSSTPKTFQFDFSTDLKKELESINPQVLDSDFE